MLVIWRNKCSPKPAEAQRTVSKHFPRQEPMVEIFFLYKSPNNQRGLSPCPSWFTKLLKSTLAELRELKHDISAYIDDMYLQGNTKTKCVSNIVATTKSWGTWVLPFTQECQI